MTNRITQQVEQYIRYKQGAGFKIAIESAQLRRFAKYTVESGHRGSLTVAIALEWINQKVDSSQWCKARKLETIRVFSRFIAAFDSRAQIPQKGLFGKCHGRSAPYIFSQHEMVLLMDRAFKLFSPDGLRCLAAYYALGTLWSTGMRPNEICRLLVSDVDTAGKTIFIRETKFAKSRFIPIHHSVSTALSEYQSKRNVLRREFSDNHFFITTSGKALKLRDLEYAMQVARKNVQSLPSRAGKRKAPRLYDIRHSFACHTLLRWLKSGGNVNNLIVFLSTYLGHGKIADTYWYLSATPELMAFSAAIFEKTFSVGEGRHEK
jgi:site-specific recombinase XerD